MENKVNNALYSFLFARFGAQTKDENDSCYQQGILKTLQDPKTFWREILFLEILDKTYNIWKPVWK